ILVFMVIPLVLFYLYKDKQSVKKLALHAVILPLFTVLFYFIVMNVFIKGYIPTTFDVSTQVNNNLTDLSPYFTRLEEMSTKLFFSERGTMLYGYFMDLFFLVLLGDIILFRKHFTKEAFVALYGVVIVYVGLAIIGYLLPLADLQNTTKRGVFKIFPLMLFYMANSASLTRLSGLLHNWEFGKTAEPALHGKPAVKSRKAK